MNWSHSVSGGRFTSQRCHCKRRAFHTKTSISCLNPRVTIHSLTDLFLRQPNQKRSMAAAADWSSLPFDLVRRVAGCLLAANDVDYYMDLRAVCGSWRSATDDPKDSPDDPRFRPRHWVVLDDADVFQSERTRLLVNTRTGRFLRKELPLLVGHRYSYVATAPGGLFVLADCDDYDAARVFNPFTGHMINFMATVPSDMVDAAAVIGSSPTLVLLCGGSDCKRYMAEPDSRSFALYQEEDVYLLIRLAVAGGMYADGEQRPVPPLPAAVADKIFDLMRVFSVDPSQMFWSGVIEHVVDDAPEIGHANNNRCYLVQFLREVFIVFKLQHRMEVFRMDDSDRGVLEPVKNIGRRAIFVGCCRCLAVDADKFPSVEANCIYHLVGMNPYGDFYFHDVYKYDLEDGTEEMVSEAINWSDPITWRDADPPFTAVQLLSSYTINVRCSELVIPEECRVDVDQLVEEFFST